AWVNPWASCPALAPVSDELNGCVGLHQISVDRLLPALPSASTAVGNSSALPTDTALGLKPCWRAWVQKVLRSGGITTPVTISTSAFLNAAICAEKSSVML